MTEEIDRIEIRRGPALRYGDIKEAIEKGKLALKYTGKLNVGLSKGTLLDFETRNFDGPAVSITAGIVQSNTLTIYQLLSKDYGAFEDRIGRLEMQEPLIAFNVDFEKSILERIGVSGKVWKELRQPVPYIDDNGEWQRFDRALMKKEFYVSLTPVDYLDGKVMPHLWKLYLLSDDPWEKARLIYNIMRHNRQCLLKELAILMMGETY